MKSALILEGGAMRGLYSAGVIDCFLKNNIEFDAIFGVSAGALFGINLVSKQEGRAIRYNLKYVNEKNYMGIHSFIKTGNIMNEDFCFNKLIYELDVFDFDEFNASKTDFFAVVTNIETGKAEYKKIKDLEDKKELEYLRASGSMPLLSKIINIDGKKYLDGGIADSVPYQKVKQMGYEKIVIVLTRPSGYKKKPAKMLLFNKVYKKYPNFLNTIKNRYKTYNEVEDLIEKDESNKEVFVFRPSIDCHIKRLEKDKIKLQEIYELGEKDFEDKKELFNKFMNK